MVYQAGADTATREATVGDLLSEAAEALRADRAGDAHKLYARALDEARDAQSRGEAFEGLGHVAHRSGRPREGARLLEQAVVLLHCAVSERPALAETLGRSYAELGELDRATVIFDECRQRFAQAGNRSNEVRFACLLGYALTDRGEFAQAEQVLVETLAARSEEH